MAHRKHGHGHKDIVSPISDGHVSNDHLERAHKRFDGSYEVPDWQLNVGKVRDIPMTSAKPHGVPIPIVHIEGVSRGSKLLTPKI